jgi:hypothetical protein
VFINKEATDLVTKQPFPKTEDEAVSRILTILDETEKEKIRNMPKPFYMIDYQFSLGRWIRNSFGLWDGNRELVRACDVRCAKGEPIADTASFEILVALWKRLHNEEK